MSNPAPQDAQTQWAQHWPFKRASAELIRKVQQAQRKPREPAGEPAPF